MAIWDQTDPTGPSPKNIPLGTLHTNENINEYIEQGYVPQNLKSHISTGEPDHGTHVTSIAAGKPCSDFPGGVAPDAKIVVVIPKSDFDMGLPVSLGYSNSHINALRFIKDFSDEYGLPAVINVSQGMNAGAHDGTSNLERGFDNITNNGGAPGIAVVKSAGNERNQCGHAKITMPSNSVERLTWLSKDPHRYDVIELWFKSNDKFRFRLIDPFGNSTEYVDQIKPVVSGNFPSGNSYNIHLTRYIEDNGDSRVLMSIFKGSNTSISVGKWMLEIQSKYIVSSGEIHAWLERNSTRPTLFLDHISDEMTISIPGTANYVLSVGSIKSDMPLDLASYSSYGPTRDKRPKPDLVAPGELILAANSNSINGVISLSGTSMAAPHVTGAIALLFSYWNKQKQSKNSWRQFNAAQIIKALTHSTQNYIPQWHPGYGYGCLDIEKFIEELTDSTI